MGSFQRSSTAAATRRGRERAAVRSRRCAASAPRTRRTDSGQSMSSTVAQAAAGARGRRTGSRHDEVVQLADLDLLFEEPRRSAARARRAGARDHRLLDLAGEHPLGDDRRLEQIGAGTGKASAPSTRRRLVARRARCAGGRARPTSATRPGSTRSTAAISIPSFERRGGDQARDLPELQELLDLTRCSRASDRRRAGDLLLRELVQSHAALGEPTVLTRGVGANDAPRTRRGAPGTSKAEIDVDGVPSPPVPSQGSIPTHTG